MKKKIPLIMMLFSMFFFSEQSIAQPSQSSGKSGLVNEISKFLGRQYDISFLKSKKDIYTFNLRIKIKKIGTSVNVSDILFTDSLGYKIFPSYNQLKKMNYNELDIRAGDTTTLIVPILILNNAKAGQDPSENNISLSNNALINIASALFYPDILQKNIAIFPLFTIRRVDIE